MKIEVHSDNPLTKYHLKNIKDERIDFKFGEELPLPIGWYELNIEYTGVKTSIDAIILNGEDIKHLMYTGQYVDGAGKRHQPGNAVWDHGGCFAIWLHTDTGFFYERIMRSITNGDYGTDLSQKYQITVDKPVHINKDFPKHLQSFFGTGDGPNWWHKGRRHLPWDIIPTPEVDKKELLRECQRLCVYENAYHAASSDSPGWTVMYADKKQNFEPPFISIDAEKYPAIQKTIDSIGMEKALNVSTYSLTPGGYVHLHRDDSELPRTSYKYFKGCSVFYWALTDEEDVLFKFGRCGLVPSGQSLFINPLDHMHSVVNQGKKTREVITIVGKLLNRNY